MSGEVSILIIENSRLDRELMKIILSVGPFVVKTVSGAEQAKQIICLNSPPDLVITDVKLKGSSGLSIIESIRSNSSWQQVPIVAIASDLKQATVIALKQSGANSIISKPYNPERLQGEVLKLTGYERVEE